MHLGIRRKLKSLLVRVKRLKPIKRVDPALLYFGQQRATTVELFGKNYWDTPISKTPHARFWRKNGERDYLDYLNRSWSLIRPQVNTAANRRKKVARYRQLEQDIAANGIKVPVRVVKAFDGRRIIDRGNHRASIALRLGIKVPIEEISLPDYIAIITENPSERYGTQLKKKPYQSIFFRGQEIVEGRRRDLLDRAALIQDRDLKNKTVLDVGCNIGVSSFNAAERGARKVYGYEVSPHIATAAMRLNVLFGLPCYFAAADFSKRVTAPVKCDTGFVFSVDQHVKNNKMLAANIKRNVKKVVYFECHSKAEMPKEIRKIFKSVELVGRTRGGYRKFYRCTL